MEFKNVSQHLRMNLHRINKNSKTTKILKFIEEHPNCTKWDIQKGLNFPYNENYVFPGWQLINVLKENQYITGRPTENSRKDHYHITFAGNAFLKQII